MGSNYSRTNRREFAGDNGVYDPNEVREEATPKGWTESTAKLQPYAVGAPAPTPPGWTESTVKVTPYPAGQANGAAQQAASASNAAPAKGKSWAESAWQWFAGDGRNPGALGMGGFNVDKSTGQLRGIDTINQRIDAGYANAGGQLMGDFMAAARGQGPSVAQQQLQRGTEATLAAQVAAANSVRGPGAASQAGLIAARGAMAGQQAASDAAVLRAQEIATARQQASSYEQQVAQITQAYIQMGLNAAQAEQAARLEVEKLEAQVAGAQADRANRTLNSTIEGVANVAGTMAGGK